MRGFLGILGLGAAALIAFSGPHAQTSGCGKVDPTTATDIVALRADADCYGTQAQGDNSQVADNNTAISGNQAQIAALQAQIDALNAAIAGLQNTNGQLAADAINAAAAQKARLDRITYLKSLPPPVVWTKCAGEGATCYVQGTANVRYGANGKYFTKSVTGSVLCSNGVFGDPIYGTVKTCETDGKVGTAPAPAPAPAPSPAPAPAAGWVTASSVTPIATPDFAFSQGVTAQGLIGTNSNAPDVVGAFRFICGPGQLLRDDPIVFPGQPGKSHLHQFYGNLSVNANSTYQSIRTSGNSTCSGPNFPLNRSGYWMPAMLDGQGNAIRPNYLVVYYKRHPASSVICTDSRYTDGCVPIPDGLRMIAGADMLNMAASTTKYTTWECTDAHGSGATMRDAAGNGTFHTMAEALAICPATGAWALTMGLDFPDCWDGVNIDSPDHRSHVAYAANLGTPIGGKVCPIMPSTGKRGKLMPVFRLFAGYSILPGEDPSKWRLSSDAMDPTKPAGWSLHGDYLEGWDPVAKKEWTDNCIDRMASCTSGNLGGGHMLTGASQPSWGFTNPTPNRLISLSTIP